MLSFDVGSSPYDDWCPDWGWREIPVAEVRRLAIPTVCVLHALEPTSDLARWKRRPLSTTRQSEDPGLGGTEGYKACQFWRRFQHRSFPPG